MARLLAAHGLPEPGTVALAAACAVEAGAPALVLSARLPGLEPLAQPVNALVSAGGTGAVSALACGGAAVGLLLHAAFALSAPPPTPGPGKPHRRTTRRRTTPHHPPTYHRTNHPDRSTASPTHSRGADAAGSSSTARPTR